MITLELILGMKAVLKKALGVSLPMKEADSLGTLGRNVVLGGDTVSEAILTLESHQIVSIQEVHKDRLGMKKVVFLEEDDHFRDNNLEGTRPGGTNPGDEYKRSSHPLDYRKESSESMAKGIQDPLKLSTSLVISTCTRSRGSIKLSLPVEVHHEAGALKKSPTGADRVLSIIRKKSGQKT